MSTARKRMRSLGLAACLLLGLAVSLPGPMEVYADTAGTYGQPNDGIDFATLENKDIYFGTYRHATAFSNGAFGGHYGDINKDLGVTYDNEKRPILWRVMGEETTGNVTMLSEYALDGYYFHHTISGTPNQWENSNLREWLNDANYEGRTDDGDEEIYGFLHSYKSGFTSAELNGPVANTDVTTTTYIYDTEAKGTTQNISDKFYIPWGMYSNFSTANQGKVSWSAVDDLPGIGIYDLSDKIAKLRNGTNVYSWLRSPYSADSNFALCVHDNGGVRNAHIFNPLGVRPSFQLNPSSVIFTSKIADSANIANGETEKVDGYYSPTSEDGRENLKLTVVNDGIGTLTGMPTGNPTVSLRSNETLYLNSLAPSQTGGDYTVNYKIVNNTGRSIDYYGFTDAKDVTGLEIPGIVDGNYTVYVWLQKNNEINSHEGTTPQCFPLKVGSDGTAYVLDLAIESDPLDFGNVTENYDPITPKSVAITTNVSDFDIRLGGDSPNSFEITNETATGFDIAPKHGLPEDTYEATVTVAGNYAKPQTLNVIFVVTAATNSREVTGFTIENQQGVTTIDHGAGTITLTMPAETDVTSLVPTITHTGASISPDSGVPQDFTTPVTYTVTAQDNATKDYVVTVAVAARTTKEITGFTIGNQQGVTTIDHGAGTIALTMPAGTDVTSLIPTITHTGASVSPDSGVPQDFTMPVTYTVTAQDNATKGYVVTVAVDSVLPSGSAPSVSDAELTIVVSGSGYFTVSLGTGTNAADSATVTSGNDGVAAATPTQLIQSGEVKVTGVATGNTVIRIGYTGGSRHGDTDQVRVTVTDAFGESGGGTGPGASDDGSARSSRDDSSSSGGGSYTPPPKTSLPASAFSWVGRTLTINHYGISPLGLVSVQWDGRTLERGTDYTVYQGSVIVRFDEDFLATQAPGEHTVRIEFLNHYGESILVVGSGSALTGEIYDDLSVDTYTPNTGGDSADNSPNANPNTGDERYIRLALMLVSLSGAVLVFRRKKGL